MQLFELYPLLLYKSPIDVVRYGGEVLYGPIIRFQSFSEPVALGCDLHKHFSVFFFFFCTLDETVRLEGAQDVHFLSPDWLGSGKAPEGKTLLKQFLLKAVLVKNIRLWVYFKVSTFSSPY